MEAILTAIVVAWVIAVVVGLVVVMSRINERGASDDDRNSS